MQGSEFLHYWAVSWSWPPGSERLHSSKWWWDVALDGIASTLLAAGLAFVGILYSLRHDRDLNREAGVEAEIRKAQWMIRDFRTKVDVPQDDLDLADEVDRYTRVLDDLVDATATEPAFSEALGDAISLVSRVETVERDRVTVLRALDVAEMLLGLRLADPKFFRRKAAEEGKKVSADYIAEVSTRTY